MTNQTDATLLRKIAATQNPEAAQALAKLADQLDRDADRQAKGKKLQAIGRSAFDGIADLVAALECDYDRLAELEDADTAEDEAEFDALRKEAGECESREDAERRIQEDPLSVEMRGGWYGYGTEPADAARPEEFVILLSTGGPATRIIGELDEHGEPSRARIQAQDWFLPWSDYIGGDSATLLTYCRCFYFGEG